MQDKNEFDGNQKLLTPVFTEEAIQTWLTSNIALYLELSPDEIDIREPFAAYDIDSSVVLSITEKLEAWIGYELEITLLWEYPTIKALAKHLEEKCHMLQVSANLSAEGSL
jgi:acyl carrier protein